jgi:hypothetical protein
MSKKKQIIYYTIIGLIFVVGFIGVLYKNAYVILTSLILELCVAAYMLIFEKKNNKN